MSFMQEIPEWTETVFSADYWGAAQELPEREPRNGIPLLRSRRDRFYLCRQAATSIFRGQQSQLFSRDATLDYSPDNQFIQPGNVLLVDTEYLQPGTKADETQFKDTRPAFRSPFMKSASDLMAPATFLFRKNSTRGWLPLVGETCPVVYPYNKRLYHPPSGLTYGRRVELVFVGYDRHGETAEPEREWQWPTDFRPDHVAGAQPIRQAHTPKRLPLSCSAGETYIPPGYEDRCFRVKSVELCLQGTLNYAKAKKRSLRLSHFAGRITTAPQPS